MKGSSRRARVWCATGIVAIVVTLAATIQSYRAPIILAWAAHHLYGLAIGDGQVQCFRGTHTTLRYRLTPDPKPVLQVVEVDWGADDHETFGPPPTLEQVRLAMSSWPPLVDRASVLFGGQIAVAGPSAGVQTYREFGWSFETRAFSAWFVVAIIAVPTAAMAFRLWRSRPAHGHCRACGYDLRASPERCPECGRVSPVGEVAG